MSDDNILFYSDVKFGVFNICIY